MAAAVSDRAQCDPVWKAARLSLLPRTGPAVRLPGSLYRWGQKYSWEGRPGKRDPHPQKAYRHWHWHGHHHWLHTHPERGDLSGWRPQPYRSGSARPRTGRKVRRGRNLPWTRWSTFPGPGWGGRSVPPMHFLQWQWTWPLLHFPAEWRTYRASQKWWLSPEECFEQRKKPLLILLVLAAGPPEYRTESKVEQVIPDQPPQSI